MEYHVVWMIDIEAETPEEAAREALAIQRDPASIATYFTVRDKNGYSVGVDLQKEEGTK